MLRGQRGMRSKQIKRKNTKGQQGCRLNRNAEVDFVIDYIVKGGVAACCITTGIDKGRVERKLKPKCWKVKPQLRKIVKQELNREV